MSEYPECDKLAKVAEDSNKIGQFLDWCEENDIVLCTYTELHPSPLQTRREELMAKYYEIDLNKVETERRAILESCRLGLHGTMKVSGTQTGRT